MKRHTIKKLSLHRETLRELSNEQTRDIAGGATVFPAGSCIRCSLFWCSWGCPIIKKDTDDTIAYCP